MQRLIVKKPRIRARTMIGIACVVISSLGLAISSGQDGPVSSADRSVYGSNTTIRVDSNLVLIPVTVTDGKGRVVNGLQKDAFTLYEDDVQQEITHFANEEAPASIGLVFDASDSMAPRLRKAREAVHALLNTAGPQDEFFLIQFSTRPIMLVPLTLEPGLIREYADRIRLGGSTALLDATELALHEMKSARNPRKGIVIISDGDDNSSMSTMIDLKEHVREADATIYAIGITDTFYYSQGWPPPPRPTGPALLREISKQTGGKLYEVTNPKQLPEIAAKIGALLRSQYLLGYAPNHPQAGGDYRHVQVKIDRPKGFPRLHAVWRLGYYPPKDAKE